MGSKKVLHRYDTTMFVLPLATDINAAVLAGVDMINRHPREGTASILILLTDGDPTSGTDSLTNTS